MGLEFPVNIKILGDSKHAVKAWEDLGKAQERVKKGAEGFGGQLNQHLDQFNRLGFAVAVFGQVVEQTYQGASIVTDNWQRRYEMAIDAVLDRAKGMNDSWAIQAASVNKVGDAIDLVVERVTKLNEALQDSAWAFRQGMREALSYEEGRRRADEAAKRQLEQRRREREARAKAAAQQRAAEQQEFELADLTSEYGASAFGGLGQPDLSIAGTLDYAEGYRNPGEYFQGVASSVQTMTPAVAEAQAALAELGATMAQLGGVNDQLAASMPNLAFALGELAAKQDIYNEVAGLSAQAVGEFATALIELKNPFAGAIQNIAKGLKALAIDSTVKAVYNEAEFLFTGNPQNQAAAIQYGLTAAIALPAATAVNALAGGSGGGGGGYGGGPSSSPGGGYGGGGGRDFSQGSGGVTYIIQIGDGFVGKPAEIAEAIHEHQQYGQRAGVTRTGFGPVRFG